MKRLCSSLLLLCAIPALGMQLYFKQGSDSYWSSVANWFTDVDGTIPYGFLPASGDSASFCTGETSCMVDTSVDLGGGTCDMGLYVNSGAYITGGTFTGYPYIGGGEIAGGTWNRIYISGGTISGGTFTGQCSITSYGSPTLSGGTFSASGFDGGASYSAVFSGGGPSINGTGLTNCYLFFNGSDMQSTSGWSFQCSGYLAYGCGQITTSAPTGTGNNLMGGWCNVSVGPYTGVLNSAYSLSTYDGGVHDYNIYLTGNGSYVGQITGGTYTGSITCDSYGWPMSLVSGGVLSGNNSSFNGVVSGGIWTGQYLTLGGQVTGGLFMATSLTLNNGSFITGGLFSCPTVNVSGTISGGYWCSGSVLLNGTAVRIPKNDKPSQFNNELKFSDVLGGGL